MADKKNYTRDKRSPLPSSEAVSNIMSRNKAKNTKPELILRKSLWKYGLKGYRMHPKNIPGKPDIAFISRKIAIFINGCFWHRCPNCNYGLPKHNRQFWEDKFNKNIIRDKKKIEQLKEMGWIVITVWECQLKKDILEKTVNSLFKKIKH